MTFSVVLPVHDKPRDVIQATLEAARALKPDQLVTILDRPSREIRELLPEGILLEGRPGWQSPCVSFNKGLEAATRDILITNPSDVIQAPGNLDIAREHFAEHPHSVLYGRVTESNPEICKGPGHAGPVLQGTDNARPMTYLMAAPTAALRTIGGWDEAYMKGVCYEDDDLACRLWKSGLDFHFRDDFQAIHQSHPRLYDPQNAGSTYFVDYNVRNNMTIFVNRWEASSSGAYIKRTRPAVTSSAGRLTWTHA